MLNYTQGLNYKENSILASGYSIYKFPFTSGEPNNCKNMFWEFPVRKENNNKRGMTCALSTEDWKCETMHLLENFFAPEKYIPDKSPLPIKPGIVISHAKNFIPGISPETEQKFLQLAAQWQKETSVLSSITMISMHPAYQRIIGMGPQVVPLILHELKKEPGHWFWALNAITGEDPVLPEDAGDIEKMTNAWLEFGKKQGYLKNE